MSTSDKLLYLNTTKTAIKTAIENKGQTIGAGDTFRSYADKIDAIETGSGGGPTVKTFTRPSEWLTMPSILESEEKIVGLFAVHPSDGNLVAFKCTGAYTVDWGDGFVEDFSSGVKAEHDFDYDDLSAGTEYNGYRQALITITPQAGQHISTVIFTEYHSSLSGSWDGSYSWLSMKMSLPYAYDISFRLSGKYHMGQVEEMEIISTGGTVSGYARFYDLRKLKKVTLPSNTPFVSSCYQMFYNCFSLIEVVNVITTNVTNMNNMFYKCYSLVTVPLFDTSSVTTAYSMFQYCQSLMTIPLFDFSSATAIYNMFNTCTALEELPLLDISSATNLNGFLRNCYKLTAIPLFDTSNVTTMNSMCYYCYALKDVPLLNTIKVTDFYNLFNGCYSLTYVPLLNTSAATKVGGMLNNTNVNIIPAFDLSSISSNTNNALINTSISNLPHAVKSIKVTGMKYGLNLGYGMMSAGEIDSLFTNLDTAVGTVTLNITGNHGAATCDRTIATAKGYTVVG